MWDWKINNKDGSQTETSLDIEQLDGKLRKFNKSTGIHLQTLENEQ